MNVIIVYVIFSLRAILAVLLVAAGAAKLADTRSFTATLLALGVPTQPENIVRSIAFAIPLIEAIVGLASISGFWQPVVNGAVLLLMAGFMLIVIIALRKAPYATCRCFGALSDSQFSVRGLVRSVLLTVGALIVFWWGQTTPSMQLNALSGSMLLLILGYLMFALGVAQAATVTAVVKARISI